MRKADLSTDEVPSSATVEEYIDLLSPQVSPEQEQVVKWCGGHGQGKMIEVKEWERG